MFDVYIAEKDVCSSGPLVRVGTVEAWGKVDETIASSFFSPVSGGRRERGRGLLPAA